MIKDYARCLEYYFEINLSSHNSVEAYKLQHLSNQSFKINNNSNLKQFLNDYTARAQILYEYLLKGHMKGFESEYRKMFQKIAKTKMRARFCLFETISLIFYFKVRKTADDFILARLFELKKLRFEYFTLLEYLLFLLYLYDTKELDKFNHFLGIGLGFIEEFVGLGFGSKRFIGALFLKTKGLKKMKFQLILWTVANFYLMMLISAKKHKLVRTEVFTCLNKVFDEMYINKKAIYQFYDAHFLSKLNQRKVRKMQRQPKERPLSSVTNGNLLYFSLNQQNQLPRKFLASDVNNYLVNSTQAKETKKFSFMIKNHEKHAKNKPYLSVKTMKRNKSVAQHKDLKKTKKPRLLKKRNANNEASKIIERMKFNASLVKLENKDHYIELRNGKSVFLPITQKIKFYPKVDENLYFNHVLKNPIKPINKARVTKNINKFKRIVRFILAAFQFIKNKKKKFEYEKEAKLKRGVSKAKHFRNFCNLVKTRLSVTKINKLKESIVFKDEITNNSYLTGRFKSVQDIDDNYINSITLVENGPIKRFIKKRKYFKSKSVDLISNKVKLMNVKNFSNRLDLIINKIIKKKVFNDLYCILVNFRMKELHTNNFINRRKMTNKKELLSKINLNRTKTSVSNSFDTENSFFMQKQCNFLKFFFGSYEKSWDLNFKLEISNKVERIDYSINFNRNERYLNFFIHLDDFHVKYYNRIIRKRNFFRVFLFFLNKLLYFKSDINLFKDFEYKSLLFIDLGVNKQKNCKKMRLFTAKVNFIIIAHLIKDLDLTPFNTERNRLFSHGIQIKELITDSTRRLPNYQYIKNEIVSLRPERHITKSPHDINRFIMKSLFFKDNIKILVKSNSSFFILTYFLTRFTQDNQLSLKPCKIDIYNKNSSFNSEELESTVKSIVIPFFQFLHKPKQGTQRFINRNYELARKAITIFTKQDSKQLEPTLQSDTYSINNSGLNPRTNRPIKSNQRFYINIRDGSYRNINFSLTIESKNKAIVLTLVIYE